jgi:hypothetical protein
VTRGVMVANRLAFDWKGRTALTIGYETALG